MKRRISFWKLMLGAGFLVLGCQSSPGANETAAPDPYITHGDIAEAPLQIGLWEPLKIDAPKYIFPMVYARWSESRTVEDFAKELIKNVKAVPKEQPIWFNTHAWMGNYKPRDPANMLAHKEDATVKGNPGLWPKKGPEIWLARHQKLLKILKANKIRLDHWALDNETKINSHSTNFKGENHMKFLAEDPRWDTEPLLGVGKPAGAFISSAEVLKSKDPNKLAGQYVGVLGELIRREGFNRYFCDPISKVYPKAVISDYGQYAGKYWGLTSDRLSAEAVSRIKKVWPELTHIPGIGTHGGIVLYGGRDEKVDRVKLSLDSLDNALKFVNGDGSKLTPWLAPPNNGAWRKDPKNWRNRIPGKRRFTPEEWERLVFGIIDRGVNKLIIWNSHKSKHDECEEEMVAVFKKAYQRAKNLRDKKK